jgi:CO/xanthine dehydrogenase Mo-binding subunit
MTSTIPATRAIGAPRDRVDGPDKVRGTARYAFEQPVDKPAYLYPVQATIAAGRITGIDTSAAEAEPGVLAVLTHENAPKLAGPMTPRSRSFTPTRSSSGARSSGRSSPRPRRSPATPRGWSGSAMSNGPTTWYCEPTTPGSTSR